MGDTTPAIDAVELDEIELDGVPTGELVEWLGTMLVRRVSPKIVRALIIVVGAATTVRLFWTS